MEKRIRIILLIILSFTAGVIFYRNSIAQIFNIVVHREGSSHGLFVPFLSLYFLYLVWGRIKKEATQTEPWGLVLVAAGLVLPVFGPGPFELHFISFIVLLAGLVLTVFGRGVFRHAAFPVFFLITTTPIPEGLYEALANYSRHIAFGGSLKIIDLLGIPYFRDGWLIQLHNSLLKVAISCSGIRYLISYFVFGIAYAFVTREKALSRILIVAATIPVSHVASILRLTIIFVMTHFFGPFWAEHKPHVFLSWCVFAAILLLSIVVDQYVINKKAQIKNKFQITNPKNIKSQITNPK